MDEPWWSRAPDTLDRLVEVLCGRLLEVRERRLLEPFDVGFDEFGEERLPVPGELVEDELLVCVVECKPAEALETDVRVHISKCPPGVFDDSSARLLIDLSHRLREGVPTDSLGHEVRLDIECGCLLEDENSRHRHVVRSAT